MANTKRRESNTMFDFAGTENDIVLHILDNIDEMSIAFGWGEVERCRTEVTINSPSGKGRIDILIWHKDGTGTIIEAKKYRDDNYLVSSIGQVLLYAELCSLRFSNYPRIVIASNYIPTVFKSIIKSNDLPIHSMQVDGDRVTYHVVKDCRNGRY